MFGIITTVVIQALSMCLHIGFSGLPRHLRQRVSTAFLEDMGEATWVGVGGMLVVKAAGENPQDYFTLTGRRARIRIGRFLMLLFIVSRLSPRVCRTGEG